MDVKYEIIGSLGKGMNAEVFEVRSSLTNTHFAAKVSKNVLPAFFEAEANIHSRVTHPNVVQFISSFRSQDCGVKGTKILSPDIDGRCGVMILELCNEGTMEGFIKSRRLATMSQISAWGSEIASGLLYLKEQGIIHRDIKPENILFSFDGVKIADFGFADFVEKMDVFENPNREVVGTPFYMPLEGFKNIYGHFTDVFALGVIFYELYTGYMPYTAGNQSQLLKSLERHKITFEVIKRLKEDRNEEFEALIIRMLSKDRSLRPTIEEIVHHPFLQQSPLETTIIIDEDDDSKMLMDQFRFDKAEFGDGDRHQFYLYLANKNPFDTPLSMKVFTNLWNRL